MVGPSRSTLYVRTAGNDWALLSGDRASAISGDDLRRVVDYLSDDDTADAILPNRLRRGYVELIERATEGEGDDQLTRYELELDTVEFSDDYPAQWQDFEIEAIPGVQEVRRAPGRDLARCRRRPGAGSRRADRLVVGTADVFERAVLPARSGIDAARGDHRQRAGK